MHNKNYVSRKAKTFYNLEPREHIHIFVSNQTNTNIPNLNAVLLDVKSDNAEYPSIFNFHPYALGWLISADKSQPLIVVAPSLTT
jgi:hypothetical protein